ncbi:IS3 family transposase [Rubrobacter naiadicus]|uniref:IS3 family transposase n=1 Tax=Rubrobacter naiadicus TaxID=1392641 RepID=UPI0030811BB7
MSAGQSAISESFVATLKVELVHPRRFPSRAAARSAVFEYLEGFYNRRRLHSSLGYVSPERFEEFGAKEVTVA